MELTLSKTEILYHKKTTTNHCELIPVLLPIHIW